MDVARAMEERRAYRSLERVDIPDELLGELARAAMLAPSCNNFQPERFVFARGADVLERLKTAFNKGNEWCFAASLVVAVFTQKKLDCVIKEREYYLFDTGLASAFLILRATELGLVAHPIAGFDPEKVKEVLAIPAENTVIALILVGKRSSTISPLLSPSQVERERSRPERLPLEKFAFLDRHGNGLG